MKLRISIRYKVMLTILALLLVWKFVTATPEPRRFRYQPSVAITPLQTQALLYLQTAFSEAVVLPQRPLVNLLVARHVQAPDAALHSPPTPPHI